MRHILQEIHSLVNGKDKVGDDLDMTPLQYEQIFQLLMQKEEITHEKNKKKKKLLQQA